MAGTEIATTAPAPVRTIAATTPEDMARAQVQVLAWCDDKLKQIEEDRLEFGVMEDAARGAGFDIQAIRRRLSKLKPKREFYEKIRAAVEAGYVIVPNFPITLFAIRTTKESPTGSDTDRHKYGLSDLGQNPSLAPAGEGQNVNPWPATETENVGRRNQETGKDEDYFYRRATEFKDVAFPVAIVKPQIIEATGEALKKLIFDEIGIVRDSTHGDPIVIGRIRERGRGGKEISFFVAWWLDLADL
jgi:hypothetical protein